MPNLNNLRSSGNTATSEVGNAFVVFNPLKNFKELPALTYCDMTPESRNNSLLGTARLKLLRRNEHARKNKRTRF